jgi:tetratricopeptide (TPR) repeat protein
MSIGRNDWIIRMIAGGIVCTVSLCGCDLMPAGNSKADQGMELVVEQDYAGALSDFDAAISEGEDIRQAYRGKGIALMGQGRYEEAVEAFEKALKSSNGLVKKIDYDINYYLAMAEFKNGNPDRALEIYNAILDLDDKQAQAYYLRGNVELNMSDREEALNDFNRAVELKDNDYDLYICIYEALAAAGYKSDGEAYINRALEKNGKMTDYQSGLFSYYLGNYDDARNSLEKAREKNETAQLVLYLGRSYAALGDLNYAATLYTEYLGKKPDAAVYNELGLIYLKQKDYDNALLSFGNGKELNDPSYLQSLMFNEAVAYEYKLDFKTAAGLMKEYLDKYPADENAQREYVFLSTR